MALNELNSLAIRYYELRRVMTRLVDESHLDNDLVVFLIKSVKKEIDETVEIMTRMRKDYHFHE